jgi:nucleotide-binding universal stress UspA family protein
MYDRILFPTDGSEAATAALEYAAAVADAEGATLHLLTVADTAGEGVGHLGGEAADALEREAESVVADAAERVGEARGGDRPVVTAVRRGSPAEEVVAYADEADVDLVVMPTQGRRGIERVLLGSVTERVVNTAPVPVLVVPPVDDPAGFAYPPGDVLVPTDGSRGAERALAEGVDLALASGARLHVRHVVETASLGPDARSLLREAALDERGEDLVDAATERAAAAGVDDVRGSVAYGSPYRELLSYVDEGDVDLVALGTGGRTEFGRFLPGGVTTKLLRTCPVPLLVVRAPADDEGDEDGNGNGDGSEDERRADEEATG